MTGTRTRPRGPYVTAQGRLKDFAELRARGLTIGQAAERLGVTRRTGDRYARAQPSEEPSMPVLQLDLMPTWEGVGLCVDQPEAMYPGNDRELRHARAVCGGCPVLAECRTWVLALPWRADPGGIVAGMTMEERGHPDLDEPGTKLCPSCKNMLPFSEFSPQVSGGIRLKSHCKACARRADAARRAAQRAAQAAALPGEPHKLCPRCKTTREVSRFYPNAKNPDGLAAWCKPCFQSLKGSE